MPNAFVPLHEYIRAGLPPISALCEIADEPNEISPSENLKDDESPCDEAPYDNAFSDIRCFQAKLADALDRKLDRLLRDLACEVLARELLTKPADIAEIVRRLLADLREEERISLRVHPDDLSAFSEFDIGALERHKLDLQLVGDKVVRRGDAFIELRDGSIDARLGVRLDTVLRNLACERDE